jgi:hypothetical protein
MWPVSSRRSSAKDPLFARQSGASSPPALAGPGAPNASRLGGTALAEPRGCGASPPGGERRTRTKATLGVIPDQRPSRSRRGQRMGMLRQLSTSDLFSPCNKESQDAFGPVEMRLRMSDHVRNPKKEELLLQSKLWIWTCDWSRKFTLYSASDEQGHENSELWMLPNGTSTPTLYLQRANGRVSPDGKWISSRRVPRPGAVA